ncbi:LOW QUALITY PROTEIN: putative BPI/LBP family protein At1g04970 [Primulina eburnea]|uniref:LOW QUALITY PROTEIN: putative BPI/LBP family protein At1g04970 n=1 Tax=Primulina eburnea TaxID=1245227 RepID=UPI003C6CAF85
MSRSILAFVLLFLFTLSCNRVQSEEGYVEAEISSKGLDFLKNLLLEKAESSLITLQLPRIEKSVKIPILGNVDAVLSNITIERIHVNKSTLQTGDTGIVMDVSGVFVNLTMNWKYSYRTWLLPISVFDKGTATVRVEGLEVGLSLSLMTIHGSPKLSLLDCGCYMDDVSIHLDGGSSWFYQGLVDAFEDKISSAVEDAVSKKIKDAVAKLESSLLSLPKEIPVTDIAILNVTFIDDPVLSESSVELKINGLVSSKDGVELLNHYHKLSHDSVSCNLEDKMTKFSIHEDVIKSASSVYFEAGKMQWMVDKLPDQSLLNTAEWRFIIPRLYKKYPNRDMNLNISISSLPIVKVGEQNIKATIPLNLVIDVLDEEELIQVACISMMIDVSVVAEISRNAVTGNIKLNKFSLSLEWSNIGELHMHLIQTFMSTLLKTAVLPYLNLKLLEGYVLPAFHGYELQDTQILYADSWIVICSNVGTAKQFNLI